jgi:hypothetical protein
LVQLVSENFWNQLALTMTLHVNCKFALLSNLVQQVLLVVKHHLLRQHPLPALPPMMMRHGVVLAALAKMGWFLILQNPLVKAKKAEK